MLKKYMLAAGLLMASASLSADNKADLDAGLYDGGFVTGFGLTTLESMPFFGGNAGGLLQVGYYGPCWMFDVGGNYFHSHGENVVFVMGHLGLRQRLHQNLFVSFGGMGLGNFVVDSHVKRQWSAGAFTGLDYQFSKHFLLSGKVYPYNYDHRIGRAQHNVFANTTLSLLYVY
jgi:hypothetical protein